MRKCLVIVYACNHRGVLCRNCVIPLVIHHPNQRYIENGASVAGNHSVRGLGPLTRGIASAQYSLGCVTVVPDLNRWVPNGFPEVIWESLWRVVLSPNPRMTGSDTKRDNCGDRGTSARKRA